MSVVTYCRIRIVGPSVSICRSLLAPWVLCDMHLSACLPVALPICLRPRAPLSLLPIPLPGRALCPPGNDSHRGQRPTSPACRCRLSLAGVPGTAPLSPSSTVHTYDTSCTCYIVCWPHHTVRRFPSSLGTGSCGSSASTALEAGYLPPPPPLLQLNV
ncbi:hypothetical protein BC628DRAFT_1060070 [Trametes gibbosa]|nr:hypothetical protein BC628DRAFT_1060070 [Trametes gibbosa]